MGLTYKKLQEKLNTKDRNEKNQTSIALDAARELNEIFQHIGDRLQNEPMGSPKNTLGTALKAWGGHLENVSDKAGEPESEDKVKSSLKELPMLQQFLGMKVPGSEQTFYDMMLDEVKKEGAEQGVEDAEQVREGIHNALNTVSAFYEAPLDLDELEKGQEQRGEAEQERIRREAAEKAALDEQAESAAAFFEGAEEQLGGKGEQPRNTQPLVEPQGEPEGVVSYEKLMEKNDAGKGFEDYENQSHITALNTQLLRAGEILKAQGDVSLANTLDRHRQALDGTSLAMDEEQTRQNLRGAAEFKEFLETETDGKTNYQRIVEVLSEGEQKDFNEHLAVVNDVLELGLAPEMTTDPEKLAQQPEVEAAQEEPPAVEQQEGAQAINADKRPETAWPQGVEPAGQIISYQQLWDKDQQGKGFHNNREMDRVEELHQFFDQAAEKLREQGKTELAQQIGEYGDALKQLTGAVYDAGAPEALAKAGGLKDFLSQKGEDGKTNYQLITEALGDEKKWFDQDLEVFNQVAETGISIQALSGEPEIEEQAEELGAPTREDYAVVSQAINRAMKLDNDPSAEITAEYLRVASLSLSLEKDKGHISSYHTNGVNTDIKLENKAHAKQVLDDGMDTLWNLKRDDGKTMREAMLDNCKTDEERQKLNTAIKKMQAAHKGSMEPLEPGKPIYTNKSYLETIRNTTQQAENVNEKPTVMKWALAQVVAAETASVEAPYKRVNRDEQKRQYIKLFNSAAFQEVTEGMTGEQAAAHCKDPGKFMKTLAAKQNEIAACKPKDVERFQKDTAQASMGLQATKTGSWLGIPRLSNSSKYERACEAVNLARRNAKAENSEELNYKAIKTVQDYIKGKEGVRTRQFGNERFNEFMKFLKSAMPEDKFKEYVDHINTFRRKPEDKIHVEDFEPKRNIREIVSDQQKLLTTPGREPTARDVAKIIAASRLVGTFKDEPKEGRKGPALLSMDYNKQIDGKKLREETDRVMADQGFQDYIKLIGVESAAHVAITNPEGTVMYANKVAEAKFVVAQAEHNRKKQVEEQRKQEQEQAALDEKNKMKSVEEEATARKNEIMRDKAKQKEWFNTLSPQEKKEARQLAKGDPHGSNKAALGNMIFRTVLEQVKQERQPELQEQPKQEEPQLGGNGQGPELG